MYNMSLKHLAGPVCEKVRKIFFKDEPYQNNTEVNLKELPITKSGTI